MKEGNFEGLEPVSAEGGQVYAERPDWDQEYTGARNKIKAKNPEFAQFLDSLSVEDHKKFTNMLNSEESGAYGWNALTVLGQEKQNEIIEIAKGGLTPESVKEIATIVSSD